MQNNTPENDKFIRVGKLILNRSAIATISYCDSRRAITVTLKNGEKMYAPDLFKKDYEEICVKLACN